MGDLDRNIYPLFILFSILSPFQNNSCCYSWVVKTTCQVRVLSFWLPEKVRRFNLGFLSQFEPFWFSPQPSAVWVRGFLFSVPMEKSKSSSGGGGGPAQPSEAAPLLGDATCQHGGTNFQGPFARILHVKPMNIPTIYRALSFQTYQQNKTSNGHQ